MSIKWAFGSGFGPVSGGGSILANGTAHCGWIRFGEHIGHGLQQYVGHDRLGEDSLSPEPFRGRQIDRPAKLVAARNRDDTGSGISLPQLVDQLQTIHLAHHDVRDD